MTAIVSKIFDRNSVPETYLSEDTERENYVNKSVEPDASQMRIIFGTPIDCDLKGDLVGDRLLETETQEERTLECVMLQRSLLEFPINRSN